MSDALAPPFLVASLVLFLAGVLKLRSPHGAARALESLGLPGSVRVIAAGEVALGVACVVHPTRALGVALALVYALFAAIGAILVRRRVACGCFGEDYFPAWVGHVIASELLATVAVASAVAGPRGVAWLASQPVGVGVVLAVAIAAAVYATVLVYTEVPRAWGAWSGR